MCDRRHIQQLQVGTCCSPHVSMPYISPLVRLSLSHSQASEQCPWTPPSQASLICSFHPLTPQETQGPNALYTCPGCRTLAAQQTQLLIQQYEGQLQAALPTAKARTGFGIFTEDMHRCGTCC